MRKYKLAGIMAEMNQPKETSWKKQSKKGSSHLITDLMIAY
jgi:hypothetical protein